MNQEVEYKKEQEFFFQRPIDILARTLWGEARGEGIEGMKAVACVVLNRVCIAESFGGSYWWGHDVQTVCLKPWQFSCWNSNDPNRKKIMALDTKNKIFRQALNIARHAVCGHLKDITQGATHYHTEMIFPQWAREEDPVCQIGNHLFYRLEA